MNRSIVLLAFLLPMVPAQTGCGPAAAEVVPPRMVQSVYMIDGLKDRVRAERLQKKLRGLDGIRNARVDLPNARALVTYDANRNTELDIGVAIQRSGYSIVVGDVEGPR